MKRVVALDVMRGLTIALMITVNTPGSWKYIYSPLRHAAWNGCTPTDLVFPFFLFIVGAAMWYSFEKHQHLSRKRQVYKVLKRVALIFLIGLFLNIYPRFDFPNVRIMGVLQRIALAYGVAAVLIMCFKIRCLYYISALVLLVYWAVLYYGGNPPYDVDTNLVTKIDRLILGARHLWKGLGLPFDPEGLLSTFPAVVTVMLGYFSARKIANATAILQSISQLCLLGGLLAVLGWVWGFILPINKSLWTSSYVLFSGGLAMLFLAFLLWCIDSKGYKKWAQLFIHFGMNPLFIFVLSGIYVKTIIYLIRIPEGGELFNAYTYMYEKVFVPIAGHMNGSLLFAVVHVFCFWLIAYVLYRNRLFVKI